MNITTNKKAASWNSTAYRNLDKNYYMHSEKKFNRDLLPTPARYYSREFPGMKIKSEWVRVKCPFHEDQSPSLSIHMVTGRYRCHACGAKGCDVLAFQRNRYRQTFQDAVTILRAWAGGVYG